MENIRIEDLYWLAGFLEGEGSFSIQAKKEKSRPSGTIVVSAVQVQKEPLERLFAMVKCGTLSSYSRKEVKSNIYHKWSAHGEYAETIMKVLFPIMSPRRKDQISTCLAWYSSCVGRNYVKSGRKTCRKGLHEWNEENTFLRSNGVRTCRICSRDAHNSSQRRIRAQIKNEVNV